MPKLRSVWKKWRFKVKDSFPESRRGAPFETKLPFLFPWSLMKLRSTRTRFDVLVERRGIK